VLIPAHTISYSQEKLQYMQNLTCLAYPIRKCGRCALANICIGNLQDQDHRMNPYSHSHKFHCSYIRFPFSLPERYMDQLHAQSTTNSKLTIFAYLLCNRRGHYGEEHSTLLDKSRCFDCGCKRNNGNVSQWWFAGPGSVKKALYFYELHAVTSTTV